MQQAALSPVKGTPVKSSAAVPVAAGTPDEIKRRHEELRKKEQAIQEREQRLLEEEQRRQQKEVPRPFSFLLRPVFSCLLRPHNPLGG